MAERTFNEPQSIFDKAMRATPNARQVGGVHYKKLDYEHWDFVTDIGLAYLPATAMKYVTRWRDKNGVQDLEKATHYLEKAQERQIPAVAPNKYCAAAVSEFASQFSDVNERGAIVAIVEGLHYKATEYIRNLVAQQG